MRKVLHWDSAVSPAPVFARGPRRTGAFSLVEILVSLGVLAVLVTLGLSATSGALDRAKSMECLNKVRQVGLAVQLYGGEHNGRLPNTSHLRAPDGSSLSWRTTLVDYLDEETPGSCPANRKSGLAVTYAWNDLLTESSGEGIAVARCRNPARTFLLAEHSDSYFSEHFHFAGSRSRVTYNQFRRDVGVARHGNGANYLFVDGHVEFLSINTLKQLLAANDSTFIDPEP